MESIIPRRDLLMHQRSLGLQCLLVVRSNRTRRLFPYEVRQRHPHDAVAAHAELLLVLPIHKQVATLWVS